jgi:hypothetical protein
LFSDIKGISPAETIDGIFQHKMEEVTPLQKKRKKPNPRSGVLLESSSDMR